MYFEKYKTVFQIKVYKKYFSIKYIDKEDISCFNHCGQVRSSAIMSAADGRSSLLV